MRTTLISPRIAVQKGDFLGSGIPYWPIELAILAAHLRDIRQPVQVIDLFGGAPSRFTDCGDHYLQGNDIRDYLAQPEVGQADLFVLFAISYMSHRDLLYIARLVKQTRPTAVVAVLENSQAVTAYAVQHMAASFFSAGVDALICGRPYFNWEDIRACLAFPDSSAAPDNVVLRSSRPERTAKPVRVKHAQCPIPAWELFNLEGYWSLPYAHGPKQKKFLPLLTSWGCPHKCDFCVVPETNRRWWNGHSAERVVEEIITVRDRFGVHDFHIEDLNPTVMSTRWEKICRLLIERSADVRFYFVSGTKAETIGIEQVPLLAQAGCRYISMSPESGSNDVLKAMGKRFDHAHGVRLIQSCHKNGIRTQACFLVGHPAEDESHHHLSREYLKSLTRAGLDEVAVFVVAPFAGSRLFTGRGIPIEDAGALPSFSPKGRGDFSVVFRRRRELILDFIKEKPKRGLDLWAQGLRSMFGRPQTKMENLPRRVLFVWWRVTRLRLSNLFGSHSTGMCP